MNTKVAVFNLFFVLVFQGYAQDFIQAGQISGINVHFTDYEPDSIVELISSENGFYLDVDSDGANDLGLFVYGYDGAPSQYRFWSSAIIVNDNLKIITSDSSITWVRELDEGDTISENQTWNSDSLNLFLLRKYQHYFYPPPGVGYYDGEFESGYLGFKIDNPLETFYGWVHLIVNVNPYSASITAKRMAIKGVTVGINCPSKSAKTVNLYPNPCDEEINIEFNATNSNDIFFEVIDSFGKKIMDGYALGFQMRINTSEMIPGIYLLRVIQDDKIVSYSRFIKR